MPQCQVVRDAMTNWQANRITTTATSSFGGSVLPPPRPPGTKAVSTRRTMLRDRRGRPRARWRPGRHVRGASGHVLPCHCGIYRLSRAGMRGVSRGRAHVARGCDERGSARRSRAERRLTITARLGRDRRRSPVRPTRRQDRALAGEISCTPHFRGPHSPRSLGMPAVASAAWRCSRPRV